MENDVAAKLKLLKQNETFKNQVKKVLATADGKQRGPSPTLNLIKTDMDDKIKHLRSQREDIVNQVAKD